MTEYSVAGPLFPEKEQQVDHRSILKHFSQKETNIAFVMNTGQNVAFSIKRIFSFTYLCAPGSIPNYFQFSLNVRSKGKINGTFCLARTSFQWTGSHYHSLWENLRYETCIKAFIKKASKPKKKLLIPLKAIRCIIPKLRLKHLPLNFGKWSAIWIVCIFSRKTSTYKKLCSWWRTEDDYFVFTFTF